MPLLLYVAHQAAAGMKKLNSAVQAWAIVTPETISNRDLTASKETARRHALEDRDKMLATVQELEKRLLIISRWTPESQEWLDMSERVSKRNYQRCLDALEGLVVARLFKLTKMNMSQTGELTTGSAQVAPAHFIWCNILLTSCACSQIKRRIPGSSGSTSGFPSLSKYWLVGPSFD